jgi:hypothetical protein
MPQFLRPNSDVMYMMLGAYPNNTVGERYKNINETVASDLEYVNSQNNPGNNNHTEFGFSAGDIPTVRTGHILRIRNAQIDQDTAPFDPYPSNIGGTATSLGWELKQGSTIIESGTLSPRGWLTTTINISSANAANITNYADLRIMLMPGGGGGSTTNRRAVAISWVELEIPDGSIDCTLSGGSVSPIGTGSGTATRTIPDITISGGSVSPIGTASGTATSAGPNFDLSGGSIAPIGVSSGTATRELPSYNLSGGSIAPIGTPSGNADHVAPSFNLSGGSVSPIGVPNGAANFGSPSNELSGGSVSPIGNASGTATYSDPNIELNGGSVAPIGVGNGSATYQPEELQLSGGSIAPIHSSQGTASTTAPEFNLNGGSVSPIGVSAGFVNSTAPEFNLNGGSIAPLGIGAGNASNQIPSNNLSGGSISPIHQGAGNAAYVPSEVTASGGSIAPISKVSGSLNIESAEVNNEPNTGKSIPVNFRILIPEPIEVKMVSTTLKKRDAIHSLERFKGMFTYVVEDDTFYYLSNGITNSHWKPIGKPQAIVILDVFTNEKQAVISGYAIQQYVLKNFYTKQEVDSLLAGLQIPAHLKTITEQEVQKLKSIQGDISQRIEFNVPKTLWVVTHPAGKDCSAFNSQGREITGRKISVSTTITSFNWSKPITGFVKIN